jgi:hypothetical protein
LEQSSSFHGRILAEAGVFFRCHCNSHGRGNRNATRWIRVERGAQGAVSLRSLNGRAESDCELRLAGFGRIVEGVAGAVAFGGFEEQSFFEAIGETGEASLAVNVGADFKIKFVEARESVGDVNLDFGSIDGLVVGAGDGEIGGAGAESGIDGRDRMRIGGLRLGEGNEEQQQEQDLHFGSIIELIQHGGA